MMAPKVKQLSLWEPVETVVHIGMYDYIIIAFSGGKDSLASILHLNEMGVVRSKLEIWHHCVDGLTIPGIDESKPFMDWPVTVSYVRAVAAEFGVPCYLSWKQGGFQQEMLRENAPTAAIFFQTHEGLKYSGGESNKLNTRLKFPQTSADLRVRWCSSYLKIDVGATALRNQQRFQNKKTLFVTGERADESPARAKYKQFEPHRSDTRNSKRVTRHIDHWRPILNWDEEQVWEIIQRHGVNPHPAYKLGWGRVSCASCIFGNPNMWASLRTIAPSRFEKIAEYEAQFGFTIKQGENIRAVANRGFAYPMQPKDIEAALADTFSQPIILPHSSWELPIGAYKESDGPQ